MALKGITLFLIQLLGRWGSDAIMRYVQDAPLSQLPALAKAVMSYSVEALAKDHAKCKGDEARLDELARKLSEKLRLQVEDARNQVLALTALQVGPNQIPEGMELVRNSTTGVIHRSMILVDETNPFLWQTMCEWSFAGAKTTFMPLREGSIDGMCKTCTRRLSTIAQRKAVVLGKWPKRATEDSPSSSDTSSSAPSDAEGK